MAKQRTADTSPSAKATTKATLVDAGTQLILEQGYHQTGIQDVLQGHCQVVEADAIAGQQRAHCGLDAHRLGP